MNDPPPHSPGHTRAPARGGSRRESSGACPLCGSEETEPWQAAGGRPTRSCRCCGLIHVDPAHHLERAAERARYDLHRNDPADPAYRAFLERLVDPLAAVLAPGATGLDFGSGPGPTLSLMMRERGFSCRDYDPFYAPHESALLDSYDFIAATEVLEHLTRPGAELARICALLRPGAWLGVMTRLVPSDEPLDAWWYARDPTHVSFFRAETMEWVAARHSLAMTAPHPDVRLFRAEEA